MKSGFLYSCNNSDKEDDDTENTISSSTTVNNIETEGIGPVSSIIRVCNTDVSHQNRIDDFYLAKFSKAFIELNAIRMVKHCNVLLL